MKALCRHLMMPKYQPSKFSLIFHKSIIPAGMSGSVAAATAALATAVTATGGVKPSPSTGQLARLLAGRAPKTLSNGTPATAGLGLLKPVEQSKRGEDVVSHCVSSKITSGVMTHSSLSMIMMSQTQPEVMFVVMPYESGTCACWVHIQHEHRATLATTLSNAYWHPCYHRCRCGTSQTKVHTRQTRAGHSAYDPAGA